MRKSFVLLLGIIFALGGVGCRKANDAERDREAIRVAIEKYLSGRSSLNREAMEMKIGQVTIEGNTAQAQVEFQAKGPAAAGFTMQMQYQLERQEGGWVVRSSRAAGDGSMPSQGGATVPPAAGTSDAMPAGHPPVGSVPSPGGAAGASQLPAGHPPIREASKTPAKKTPPKK